MLCLPAFYSAGPGLLEREGMIGDGSYPVRRVSKVRTEPLAGRTADHVNVRL
jgi:hypothetical protein